MPQIPLHNIWRRRIKMRKRNELKLNLTMKYVHPRKSRKAFSSREMGAHSTSHPTSLIYNYETVTRSHDSGQGRGRRGAGRSQNGFSPARLAGDPAFGGPGQTRSMW